MTVAESNYDVVVVGAGVAGLSAALSTLESGARVAVVERAPETEMGGNTRYTEAFLRLQSLDEVSKDFSDRLLGDFMGYPDPDVMLEGLSAERDRTASWRSANVLDAAVVETFAEQVGPTVHWLEAAGVRFTPIVTPFLTTSTTRLAPSGGGLALVEGLFAAVRARGGETYFEHTARQLVGDGGRVDGVQVRRRGGTELVLRGRVVLACGGFEGNPEMLSRHMGLGALATRPVARGGYYNKGEGIEMALAVGAAPCGNFSLFHAEPIDPRSGVPEPAIFVFPYGILVNGSGQRFVDEAPGPVDAWYERITRRINEQAEGIAYVILDGRLADVPNARVAIRTDQPGITGGSIAELARKTGLPGEALEQTVAGFNAACTSGQFVALEPDGLATQGLTPPKSNWARPIDTPPYEAYPIIAANVFTFGGVKVDPQARVIDLSGDVIDGLYAAGETMGMYFTNYTGSTSVLRGAVFGRIAGRAAAAAAGVVPVGTVGTAGTAPAGTMGLGA